MKRRLESSIVRVFAVAAALASTGWSPSAQDPVPEAGPDVYAPGLPYVTPGVAQRHSFGVPEGAWDPNPLDAIRGGRFWLSFRPRYEFVDDGAFPQQAHSTTLRTKLGVETAQYEGFSGVMEFQDITFIGNTNLVGGTNRPNVVDPEGTEVNQVYLRYTGLDQTNLVGGRRVINLDNERFIGAIAWRQNDQTFDGVTVDSRALGDLDAFGAYLSNSNRITATNEIMSSWLVNLAHPMGGVGKAVAYWYHFDTETTKTLSTSTVGLRFLGDTGVSGDWKALYTAEFAIQQDVGDNPNQVDADYLFGELGVGHPALTTNVGYEVQSGSTASAGDKFTTPFGTNHAFNGWADRFLVTPDTGLKDLYVRLNGPLWQTKWLAAYHDFSAEAGGADYGQELDLQLLWPLSREWTFALKYADYMSDGFKQDTRIFWFWLELAI